MAITKTQIINKALILCGATTVISIDDGTTNANTLSNVYEMSLRSILSECKWNFATTRANLSAVPSGSTQFVFYTNDNYVYALPSDVVRIYDTNPYDAQWREEEGFIISDTATMAIRYVQYLDVPSKFPSYFLDAFVDKLCSDIAYTIINSATIAEAFIKKYETVTLPKAVSSNSQTGVQQQPIDDAWTLAKFFNESADA